MAKRVTIEDVNQRLLSIENKYKINLESEIIYFNGSISTIKHKCIDCGEFKTNALKNLKNGRGLVCLKCASINGSKKKLISEEVILEKIKQIDNIITIEFGAISEPYIKYYNGSESIIEHKCLLCSEIKESNYGNYIKKSGLYCRDCSYKKISTNMTLTSDLLQKKLICIHENNKFKSIGEYKGRNTLFSLNCNNCCKSLTRSFNSLIEGYPLCDECLKLQRAKKLAFSQHEVKDLIESQTCKWLSGEYYNNRSLLEIQCNCGNLYKCSLAEFQDGQTQCQNCSKAKSTGERLIEEVLYFYCKKFNYSYIYQKTFEDLKNNEGNLLRFDFEIFDEKGVLILIEFHGEQHYNFIRHFHKSAEDFLKQQENDLIKEQYCSDKGYTLLIISYIDLLICQEVLMNYLNFSNNLKSKFYENLNEIRYQLWKNRSILVFTIHERYIDCFMNISEVVTKLSSKNIKISHSSISECLSNKLNQVKGLIFIKYCDIDKLTCKIDHIKKQKPSLFYMVKLTNIENNKNSLVMSVNDATSFLNLTKSSRITQACHKNREIICDKHRIVNGYICEWLDCPPCEIFIS